MLYKNIFRVGLTLVFASSLFTACQDDDYVQRVNTNKPVVTIDNVTATATEGDEITFTLTTDKISPTEMDFKIDLIRSESTAEFRDFTTSGDETDISGDGGYGQAEIGYLIHFPAMTQTFTFTITPSIDFNVEQTETLKLRLRSAGNGMGAVNPSSEIITITVNEYMSNEVRFQLDWSASTTDAFGTIHEGTYEAADPTVGEGLFSSYDFDIYIFDESFSMEMTDSAGATSASPEEVVFPADAPDGIYYVIADLYDSGEEPAEEFTFDMKLRATKPGTWSTTLPITTYTSSYGTSAPAGLGDGAVFVAVLTKTGDTYVLENYDTGEVLASGKRAQLQSLISAKRSARH